MSAPKLWVVAGPNGAGKTTLTRLHLTGHLPVVNPDDIAEQLDIHNRNTALVQMRAGRLALLARDKLLAGGRSFAIETTLSGNSELDLMYRARRAGYQVILAFVGVDDVGLLIARVKSRVADGGHAVPLEAIQRRYRRSMDNLGFALQIADRAWVFENKRKRGRRTLLIREADRLKYVSQSLPMWARQAIPTALRKRDWHHKKKNA
ncbi:zeta toxin family protein [Advenella mimigardefordensis]|uniref:Putative P-loop nucleoside triphosphate hydrolase domain-containing zeta toxin protein n=1 Tax=Advenella mimigardefordensis (strain DSM 17166 / LMG 22922 / DPN7) TaxID=1247726 RepID=W0PEF0_ADVMD|nr:zeta toxin family protein [Advenella mimigardefordensis]AHG63862.1 putative P-loop nucleoside triphosphate hydrolase domain-containing zeta toxin protein [Advenella mimigardefordensis DPN7]